MPRLPLVARTASLAALSSVCLLVAATSGHADPARRHQNQVSTAGPGITPTCVADKLIKMETVEPDPNVADPTGQNAASVYEYGDSAAPTVVIIPPTGWDPNKATVRELHFYGFESRPSDPAALQKWDHQLVGNPSTERNLKRPTLDGPICTTPVQNGVTHTERPMSASPLTATTPNWAGIVAHGNYHYIHDGRTAC